jgi:hypothetical protein
MVYRIHYVEKIKMSKSSRAGGDGTLVEVRRLRAKLLRLQAYLAVAEYDLQHLGCNLNGVYNLKVYMRICLSL